jgi:hypothetical protein
MSLPWCSPSKRRRLRAGRLSASRVLGPIAGIAEIPWPLPGPLPMDLDGRQQVPCTVSPSGMMSLTVVTGDAMSIFMPIAAMARSLVRGVPCPPRHPWRWLYPTLAMLS